ncbi:MAG: VanZ family protein, partial [bacterium]
GGHGLTILAVSFVICVIYSVSDELLQRFVPKRSSSVGDLVADATGAALAIGISHAVWRRRISDVKGRSSTSTGAVTY